MCSSKWINPFEHTKMVTKIGVDAAKKGTDFAVKATKKGTDFALLAAKKTTPTVLGGQLGQSRPNPLNNGFRS